MLIIIIIINNNKSLTTILDLCMIIKASMIKLLSTTLNLWKSEGKSTEEKTMQTLLR